MSKEEIYKSIYFFIMKCCGTQKKKKEKLFPANEHEQVSSLHFMPGRLRLLSFFHP